MAAGENNEEIVLDMSLFDFSTLEKDESAITQGNTEGQQELSSENIENDNTEKPEKVSEIVGETKVQKEPSDEDKGKNPESPADSEEVFKPLAEFLKEQGFFSDLELEIKNENDLAEAFKQEIKKNEYADLNESQIEYLEALRNGIPDQVIQGHQKTQQVFENITDDLLEDEEVRKQVIIEDRIASGWSRERAEKDYKRIYDNGDSLDEAKLSRDNLKVLEQQEFEKAVQQEKQNKVEAEKQAKKQLEDLKTSVFKEDNLFGTFKVNEGLKQKVHDSMTKVVDYTPDGLPLNKLMKHRLDNPIEFEKNLYYIYELTDGFRNIDKLTAKATTSAAKKLSDAVQKSTYIRSSGGITPVDNNEYSSPIVEIVDINNKL